jgi:DGQHR domain-containing protein
VKIIQKSQVFYIAKAPASEIIKMFTVSPAKYDVRKLQLLASTFKDEQGYYNSLISNKNEKIKKTDFQRDKDVNRVNKISKFLLENEYSYFPNTIICTCDLIDTEKDNKPDEIVENYYTENQTLSFLTTKGNDFYLYIPIINNSILVIDGQHRLEGLKKYCEENNECQFEIILSFFLDLDRAIIAQQFYTINYEQKSVNKSILYHLMGEFSDEINELTLLHNYVRILNELDKSPFYSRIKMLGKTPPELGANEKQKLSISQAFLIDELLKTISKKSYNSIYQPIFLKSFNSNDLQISIVKTIINFFNAVEHLRPDWNTPEVSVLSKGLGVGALIKVLQFLVPMLYIDNFFRDYERTMNLSKENYIEFLKGIEDLNIKSFSGQGGAGSISKIKEAMVEKIEYFNANSYAEFEDRFKTHYLQEFKKFTKSML